MNFWDKDIEKEFFRNALKITSLEKVFYKINKRFLAYIPKKINFHSTLQSRNALIGNFTEKWVKDFLTPIAKENNLYCINGVICEELGLNNRTPVDIAFCKTNEKIQKQENIKAIFEVKMSIINNYEYNNGRIDFVGDLTTHKGNPSLLRSDSMLKAIGKCVNIRLKNTKNFIPLFVLGNTYISNHYSNDVDLLKQRGIIQGFINLYPYITPQKILKTLLKGFITFFEYEELKDYITNFLNKDIVYISKAISKEKLRSFLKVDVEEFLLRLKEIDD